MIIINILILLIIIVVCFCLNKINLFFVSFTPLFLILFIDALNSSDEKLNLKIIFSNWLTFTLLLLIIFPPIMFIVKLAHYKKKQLNNKKITNPEKIGDGIVSYIVTYIVPLSTLGVGQGNSKYFDSILIFIMIMILYIRYDLVYFNPMLALFFNVYKVTLDKKDAYVMTRMSYAQFKDKISGNNRNSLYKISNSLYLLRKITKKSA